MSEKRLVPCCADPESLVVMAAIPMCRAEEYADTLRFIAENVAAAYTPSVHCPVCSEGECNVPLRRIAAMPCADAVRLIEQMGDAPF